MTEPAKTLHCRDCRATVDADRRELTVDWHQTWDVASKTYPTGRLVYQCPACRPGGPMTTKRGKR